MNWDPFTVRKWLAQDYGWLFSWRFASFDNQNAPEQRMLSERFTVRDSTIKMELNSYSCLS
jgi:hypothetical protein